MAPRKRRVLPWVIGAAVVLAAAVGVAGVVIPPFVRTVTDPIDDANAYLRLLKAGDTAGAYQWMCSEARAELDLVEYREMIRQEGEATGELRSFNVHTSKVEIGGDAFVAFDVATARGRLKQEARLVKEEGEWRWCGARPRGD
jgi:hypothetical protein